MLVGNDVVDLRDPENQPAAIHPRFDLRVFTAEELELLDAASSADSRHRLRWTLWAAKESAFKAFARRSPGLSFRPRRFVVKLDEPCRGRVRWDEREIPVRIDVNRRRIHAVAGPPAGTGNGNAGIAVTGVHEVQSPGEATPLDASREVRHLAVRAISRLLGVGAGSVEIAAPMRRGTGGGVPRALLDGVELPIGVSLSHDGRWLAFALSCRTAWRAGPASRPASRQGPGVPGPAGRPDPPRRAGLRSTT